jgi:hypothetical protein
MPRIAETQPNSKKIRKRHDGVPVPVRVPSVVSVVRANRDVLKAVSLCS